MSHVCPDCDDTHGLYFSEEVVTLYRKIQETEDPNTRVDLMMKMAEIFAEDTDPTDPYIDDAVHKLVDECRKTFAAHEQTTLTLARVLMRSLDHEDLTIPDGVAPMAPDGTAN